MNKDIDAEFTDINKESKYKTYVVVILLYIFVIILTILLIWGLNKQKDVVDNNLNSNNDINQIGE